MHCTECFVTSAVGGFKINGPPRIGKGPMTSKEVSDTSNEASLPQPTQAGRIETCTELIRQAMRCLENNDRECVMRLIEELVRNQCHDGRLIGKEIADGVRDIVHELWLRSNDEYKCELLKMLKDLDVSKGWFRSVSITSAKMLDKWIAKCGVRWESKMARYEMVKEIEDLLRERFGWDEIRMCEELFRFIGVDVNEFRKHGIEPCVWLNGLEKLGDLRRPYWFGMARSDMTVRESGEAIRLAIETTSTIGAAFFPALLGTIKTPSLQIKRKRRAPAAKYVSRPIALTFYVDLGVNEWPWPIELSADKLERILNSFSDEELAEFIAGLIDGDGSVLIEKDEEDVIIIVKIAACENCPKRFILDVVKEIITKRFNIIGTINRFESENTLLFCGEKAVRLLRRVAKYMHHPLRRLRAELILAYYDGRISDDVFMKLYEQTKYEEEPDIKRNHALEALTQAAPQTHTHGETK
jgi:hypothetical protein